MTKEGNHLKIIRFTRDVLFVNLVLLCGDVLQNPEPVRIQCFNCHKTISKNQGRADCSDCLQSYHLKCLGTDLETNKKCFCVLSKKWVLEVKVEVKVELIAPILISPLNFVRLSNCEV